MGWAVGTLLGGVAQFLIQVPALWREGWRLRASDWAPADPGIRARSRALMGPATVGLAAVQVNIFVEHDLRLARAGRGVVAAVRLPPPLPADRRLRRRGGHDRHHAASRAGPPRATWTACARRCRQSLRTARVPHRARHRRADGARPCRSCACSTSAAASRRTTREQTAAALALYAIGLVAYTGVKVLAPAFYALGTPARAAAGQRERGGHEPGRDPRAAPRAGLPRDRARHRARLGGQRPGARRPCSRRRQGGLLRPDRRRASVARMIAAAAGHVRGRAGRPRAARRRRSARAGSSPQPGRRPRAGGRGRGWSTLGAAWPSASRRPRDLVAGAAPAPPRGPDARTPWEWPRRPGHKFLWSAANLMCYLMADFPQPEGAGEEADRR